MNKSKFLGFTILLAVICVIIAFDKFQNLNKLEHEDFVEFKIDNPNDEIEIINKSLKIYLDKIHRFHNFSEADIKKQSRLFLHGQSAAINIFEKCNGDKKHDDKCEFMTFDKRLNLEYLMNLGEKICINGKPIENAEEIIKNDEILQNKKPFYPQDEKALVDENGNFITNFFYDFFAEGIYRDYALFYGKVFINKNIFTHTNKNFDIIISANAGFKRLFFAINKNPEYFCQTHNDILTKFDDRLPYYKDYLSELATVDFAYIPIKLIENGAYDILTLRDILLHKNTYGYNSGHFYCSPQFDKYTGLYNDHDEYNVLFEQYQILKNNNFNKNLNLQGDGNAKN
ncbi:MULTISPECIES: hypothetical protein [unclassified Campylobacter]|uniref:hypothetical protein n=1 Tax=unclassified Campylobacter TaxID=2593542 RepID=UPI0022E9F804|nr:MULTISPECIES: hypothetical protein [unclassified Campylobacter]MDA3056538.1 hypothetical protein [Campylobacter sp. CN_NA1]MDA3065634.1 hypothetical protein [Campylobacter sp. CN_NE4]MDA3069171.1 hypothetical protein [Campylobacter sp. CN_NE3]MDA3083087.1 hypothetical protein [Campylobacter sp. CN_EL2]MDA3084739.1 hypothetical protein [Campylobacter sp. CN_NE1]